jgi:hypothetical protein
MVERGDLDGDGDLDLTVANQDSGDIAVLLNDGDGTFAHPARYAVGGRLKSVAIGDLSGDGHPDLAVANNVELAVFHNVGNGTFTAEGSYAVGETPKVAAPGDLDGDGDLDLVVTDRDGDRIWVLRNAGDGTFADSVPFETGDGPRGMAVADLDADGDADVVVANMDGDDVSVLLNNGDGTFASETRYGESETRQLSIALGMVELGVLKGVRGDPEEGLALTRQAAETFLRLHGLGVETTMVSLYATGLNLQWMGHLDEAEDYFVKYRSAWDAFPGRFPGKPLLADFLLHRVRMLQGEVGADQVLPIAQELLDSGRLPFFEELALTTKAFCLVRLGRYDEAERVMQQLPGKLMKALPEDHYERRLYNQALAEMYEGLGQPEKAAQYRALLREAEGS